MYVSAQTGRVNGADPYEGTIGDEYDDVIGAPGLTKKSGAVFCTCGIHPNEGASVPDPRLAWRHMAHCAHSQARKGE